jgi:hypothetical protein
MQAFAAWQGVAAKKHASYDLSRERASVTGQTSIAASATTSLPNGRVVTALFAGALFLSAFLLFVLEPMVAKSILPTLGRTPMVWNTRLRGTEVVDLVEAEAARDDQFKWALGKIWIVAKGLPPDVVERIVIASGNAIRQPSPRKSDSRAPAIYRSLQPTNDLRIANASHSLVFGSPAA